METVKNLAGSVFGSNSTQQNETAGVEPVSGQTGPGTVDEPYDKGNETSNEEAVKESNSTNLPTRTTTTDPKDTMSPAPTTSTNPTGDPSSGQQPLQKQQGSDRPTEEPSNPAQNQAISSTKAEAESAQAGNDQGEAQPDASQVEEGKRPRDEDERQEMAVKGELPKIPGDHSGEPMKMHGDVQGEKGEGTDMEGTGGKTDRSKSVAQEGGGEHGKEKGTGEQWVKSTGLAAEGGDFDATKPGAGKEATRLLEQQGVHKDKPADTDAPVPKGGDEDKADKADKPSTMEKIKDKLHIGTGKHGSDKAV